MRHVAEPFEKHLEAFTVIALGVSEEGDEAVARLAAGLD